MNGDPAVSDWERIVADVPARQRSPRLQGITRWRLDKGSNAAYSADQTEDGAFRGSVSLETMTDAAFVEDEAETDVEVFVAAVATVDQEWAKAGPRPWPNVAPQVKRLSPRSEVEPDGRVTCRGCLLS